VWTVDNARTRIKPPPKNKPTQIQAKQQTTNKTTHTANLNKTKTKQNNISNIKRQKNSNNNTLKTKQHKQQTKHNATNAAHSVLSAVSAEALWKRFWGAAKTRLFFLLLFVFFVL